MPRDAPVTSAVWPVNFKSMRELQRLSLCVLRARILLRAVHCILGAGGVFISNRSERMNVKNKQVLLASRPAGPVEESHFRIVESDVPTARDGEFVMRA